MNAGTWPLLGVTVYSEIMVAAALEGRAELLTFDRTLRRVAAEEHRSW